MPSGKQNRNSDGGEQTDNRVKILFRNILFGWGIEIFLGLLIFWGMYPYRMPDDFLVLELLKYFLENIYSWFNSHPDIGGLILLVILPLPLIGGLFPLILFLLKNDKESIKTRVGFGHILMILLSWIGQVSIWSFWIGFVMMNGIF